MLPLGLGEGAGARVHGGIQTLSYAVEEGTPSGERVEAGRTLRPQPEQPIGFHPAMSKYVKVTKNGADCSGMIGK
eukprot:9318798-Pyramimonas_sp.AAC.1